MRVGLILISASLLLAACGGKSDRVETTGGKPRAALTIGEDIKKAARKLPDNLAGDSANRAHLGEPIIPQ
ncbi:hypothetical protein [Pedomonas sp. V897]|uniref:hypothetical protein n=1 Tax=Pedomonas sp. V897 TaxID=3446482 RepID=UPI003EE20A1B